MYAVIETGGKQYKVAEGDIVAIERLAVEKDTVYTFDKVLLTADKDNVSIGQPYTETKVTAKVLGEEKDKKVIVQKFKNKTGYSRKQGHRQIYTMVQIEKIS